MRSKSQWHCYEVDTHSRQLSVSVGAAVLCLDKKGGSHYWPAKVEAVNPPKGKAVEGTYSILFCDGARKQVTRKWILVQEEEEFFTCKVCSPGHYT